MKTLVLAACLVGLLLCALSVEARSSYALTNGLKREREMSVLLEARRKRPTKPKKPKKSSESEDVEDAEEAVDEDEDEDESESGGKSNMAGGLPALMEKIEELLGAGGLPALMEKVDELMADANEDGPPGPPPQPLDELISLCEEFAPPPEEEGTEITDKRSAEEEDGIMPEDEEKLQKLAVLICPVFQDYHTALIEMEEGEMLCQFEDPITEESITTCAETVRAAIEEAAASEDPMAAMIEIEGELLYLTGKAMEMLGEQEEAGGEEETETELDVRMLMDLLRKN